MLGCDGPPLLVVSGVFKLIVDLLDFLLELHSLVDGACVVFGYLLEYGQLVDYFLLDGSVQVRQGVEHYYFAILCLWD